MTDDEVLKKFDFFVKESGISPKRIVKTLILKRAWERVYTKKYVWKYYKIPDQIYPPPGDVLIEFDDYISYNDISFLFRDEDGEVEEYERIGQATAFSENSPDYQKTLERSLKEREKLDRELLSKQLKGSIAFLKKHLTNDEILERLNE